LYEGTIVKGAKNPKKKNPTIVIGNESGKNTIFEVPKSKIAINCKTNAIYITY
jgi:hypothetical protein